MESFHLRLNLEFVSLQFFIILAGDLLLKVLFFLKGDPPYITDNPENQSVTTGANSGKPSHEAELTVCKFGVK